ncbi:type VI secretion lipoprotein TssJ [Geomonas sp. RF6]|uniref:type VI secretion lipoprotein TssJ n=1 Tax=Geomonas sp. RF6 TaxID=2897342 RepID=UPI001E283D8C|nr:type VI secretion lipoprotein TssJ [Geomonas sp. RF6]UFS69187.1 type VI secretion lipoprotein TssJ [Geomonas sp. RF6]
MRPLLRFLLTFAAMATLASCASTPIPQQAPAPPQWSFEREAIRLRLVGDQQLNLYHKTPHALVTCLYQLRDPNAFNQAVGEPDGMARLLECSRFDPSVATAKRLVIQPRQELEERVDRAEGARYLGYVAGYFAAPVENSVYLVEVPVIQHDTGQKGEKALKPAPVTLDLRLGPDRVVAEEETH